MVCSRLKKALLIALAALVALLAAGYSPDTDPRAMKAKYASPASQFIEIDPGFAVHVRDQGVRTGRTLVLIHGGGSSLHTWEPWVTILGAKHRVITFDLPGHGLTGPHPSGTYTQQHFVDFSFRLMTKLGVERAVIGGNSVGGGVAWLMAVQQPARCEALVLVDAVGSPDGPARSAISRIAKTPLLGRLLTWVTPRALAASGLRGMFHDATRINDAMVDRYWELARYPGNRDATVRRAASAALNPVATKEQMARLPMPVLVQWGAEDRVTPVAGARWFAGAIPAARLAFYPGAGHLPMEEQPQKTAADVLEWLGSRKP